MIMQPETKITSLINCFDLMPLVSAEWGQVLKYNIDASLLLITEWGQVLKYNIDASLLLIIRLTVE